MDFYSDDSDPDIDEDLREDLDALRRSCILSGADPDAAVAQLSSSSCLLAGPSTPAVEASAKAAANDLLSDDDEDDEDLALVRTIRANLRLNKASPPPDTAAASSPRPICTWPPSDTDDDDEDDLETLRAIQRRFSHYRSGTSTASPENLKSEALQGVHSSELFANGPDEEFVGQKEDVKGPNRTGFPKAALLLVDALKKNRACQKFIRRKMVSIEAKIEENKDLRDRVKCLLGYQLSCRRSVGRILCQKEDPRVRLISSRKLTAQCAKNKNRKMPALFLGPAENLHVSKYKMVLKQFPMSLQKQPWLDPEKDKLARGIKQQYQETLILDSMNNGSTIGDFSAVDMAYALTNAAGNFEVTPESLRSVLPLINWDKVAAMYLPGRSGAECESRWLNCDDPLINHSAWTAQEETRLLLIVQEKGMCNWINIAASLGTHRTPFQCISRYQRSLNPHILNKAWTKEEDLQLQAAVETFGENWQLVSAALDGRAGNQCSNRWRKTLHPKRTRVGRWDLDEDKRLMVSVTIFGSGSWSRIAQFIPGRTQSQCSERWRNVLDPDIDLGEWRPEEDSKLLASVSELGPCWAKIARVIIPHRTDNMCYRRWQKLCKDKSPSVKAASQIKKAIFQSNFVDREKERPAIGPADLISIVQSQGDGCGESTVMGRAKKRTEESIAVSDGPNSPGGRSRPRKRKSTTNNNVAVQRRMRGSIPVDSDAVPEQLRGTVSAENEVGTNRREPLSVAEEGVVKKRMRRSKPDGNEGVVRKRMRGSISADNEAGTYGTREPVSVGEEGVVIKRTRRLNPVGNSGVVRKRMRGSISADNEAGTNQMMDPVSVGEEGVAKKRMRRSKPDGNEGVVRKRMRGSTSVGDEGLVKKRVRASVSNENNGGVRRKKASSRKSAKDNLTADGVADAAAHELDLPSVPSEERVLDAGNVNKGRRKSTPRPKLIDMSEGDADKHSTSTRLASCLSFARMNGTNRNRR